jgi:redox-sensitive bicupin YhaK (pirin superfamily)
VSNLEANPQEAFCAAKTTDGPASELLYAREVVIGTRDGTAVFRTLPNKERRMIGAWCFVDHYGPTDITGKPGMSVAPHPHSGLQTVSWLVAGEVLHHDSLGNEQLIVPGQLNLMTAGHGISHAEQSPAQRSPILHGVQLWVALPGSDREVGGHFEHHADLPSGHRDGLGITVLMGQLAGLASPAKTYTPIVGAQLSARAGTTATVPLNPEFEHGLLDLDDGKVLEYLGLGRDHLELTAERDSRWLLLGGVPFTEEIVMWWNFVGRSHDDIVRMREQWATGDRYGTVTGFDGAPLPAPPMPATTLVPRGRRR